VIGKVAEFCPALIATVAGTVTRGELAVTCTTTPPVGAAPLKNTLPVDGLPPATIPGSAPEELSTGAKTVKVSDFDSGPTDAVSVPELLDDTGDEEIWNRTEVFPSAIVTLGTTVTALLVFAKLNVSPPAGAGNARVIVPLPPCPPINPSVASTNVNEMPWLIVNVVDTDDFRKVAVIFAVV
jgi:hypothetical protein